MFYLALGYFVSYLPYAALVKALSLGLDAPTGGPVLLIAVLVGAVIALRSAMARCIARQADAIDCMTAEHRAAVLALAPEVVDRIHCLAEGDIAEPSAKPLDDHRRSATVIQRTVRARLAEQFS